MELHFEVEIFVFGKLELVQQVDIEVDFESDIVVDILVAFEVDILVDIVVLEFAGLTDRHHPGARGSQRASRFCRDHGPNCKYG